MSGVSAPATSTLLSIVTVSLNAAGTIRDTLQSVVKQKTSFQVEHVCIDGGSRDGTREIIDEFAPLNQLLKRVYEPDRGLFDAMNKGLQQASGEYVLFLNADDFLIGDCNLDAVLREITTGEVKPDMLMCEVLMGQLNTFGLWRRRRAPFWLPFAPRSGAHPPHQGNFIRRDLLLKAGGFDATQRFAADTTQFYKLVLQFNPTLAIAHVPVTFMRSGGASNASFKNYRSGNLETFLFLRQHRALLPSTLALILKLAQKLFEYRLGTLRREQLLAT